MTAAPTGPEPRTDAAVGRCSDAFSTPYGDRRCDLAAGHDGYHVRNDDCGRPEYFWGKPPAEMRERPDVASVSDDGVHFGDYR